MCLVYSSIYKTMNRIEIVIGSTKTIDMEAEDTIKLLGHRIKNLEEEKERYANQRVIEELEKLLENESNEWVDDEDGNEECGVRIVYSIRLRDRIKELKQ